MQSMSNNLFSTTIITSTGIITITGTTGYCTWGKEYYRSMS